MTAPVYRAAMLVFDAIEGAVAAERPRLLDAANEEAWRLAVRWAEFDDLAGSDGDSAPARAAWHEAVAAARICDLLSGLAP